jgi:hypothetical protein
VIVISTTVLGPPIALMPASVAGLRNSIRPTKIINERMTGSMLKAVFKLLGMGA